MENDSVIKPLFARVSKFSTVFGALSGYSSPEILFPSSISIVNFFVTAIHLHSLFNFYEFILLQSDCYNVESADDFILFENNIFDEPKECKYENFSECPLDPLSASSLESIQRLMGYLKRSGIHCDLADEPCWLIDPKIRADQWNHALRSGEYD